MPPGFLHQLISPIASEKTLGFFPVRFGLEAL
jgi:hypothetical protein